MFGKVMNAPLRNLLNVFKKYLHKYQIKILKPLEFLFNPYPLKIKLIIYIIDYF